VRGEHIADELVGNVLLAASWELAALKYLLQVLVSFDEFCSLRLKI
jgi:hypothetical protein